MAPSILGKRTRGTLTKRVTRSFCIDNDENKRPVEEVPESDFEEDSEDEEVTTFSPAVTATPSARRTKVYKLDAIEYRKCPQPPPASSGAVVLILLLTCLL